MEKSEASEKAWKFSELLRAAHLAGDDLDMFDPKGPADYAKLDALDAEWRASVIALVRYAQANGDEMLPHWDARPKTGKSIREEDRAAYEARQVRKSIKDAERRMAAMTREAESWRLIHEVGHDVDTARARKVLPYFVLAPAALTLLIYFLAGAGLAGLAVFIGFFAGIFYFIGLAIEKPWLAFRHLRTADERWAHIRGEAR